MVETTPNLGLRKPLENEFVNINTLNENMDKVDQSLGAVNDLPTSATNVAGAISEIYDQLANKPSNHLTLTQGVQVVQGGDVPAILHPAMQGRTLVNLLGRDGNCESIAPFTLTGTVALSTTRRKSGSNSIKLSTISNVSWFRKDYTYTMNITKSYLLAAWIYIESYTAGVFDLSVRDVATNTRQYGTVADTSKVGKWQLLYVKIPTANTIGTGFKLLTGLTTTGTAVAYIDDIRIYELSSDDFAAIGTTLTTDEAIDSFIPYVDDMKHVNAVYIENKGKNLLPPFSEWLLHANAVVKEPYSLTLNASVPWQTSSVKVPVISGAEYTLKVSGHYLEIYYYDRDGNPIGSIPYSGLTQITFTPPSGCASITVNLTSSFTGMVTWEDIMLNIGPEPLPFEPLKPSYLYLPDCNLRSNVDGSVADRLYTDGQGKPRVTRQFREVVLGGSLNWIHHASNTGYKSVKTPMSNHLWNSQQAVKFDGKILPSKTPYSEFNQPDQSYVDNSNLFISITNVDSGWGESYTPTADEIKAYFRGWRYLERNTSSGVPGTKRWVPVGSNVPQTTTSTTGSSTNSLVVASAASFSVGDTLVVNGFTPSITGITGTTITLDKTVNVASGDYVYKVTGLSLMGDANGTIPQEVSSNYTFYRLMYQLAQSIDEPVTYEGSLMLHEGENQVEVGTGIVVREAANQTVLSSDVAYVNVDAAGYTKLSKRLLRFVGVYRDGNLDKSWKYNSKSAGAAYGEYYATLQAINYDPTAAYSVTYLVLDNYSIGIAPQTISAEYAPNIRESVESLVRELVESRTETSVLANTKAQKQRPQWIASTLRNDWVNFASSMAASYRKNESGEVELRGVIRNGITTDGVVLFYLPTDYKPTRQTVIGVLNYHPSTNEVFKAFLVIDTDGKVTIYGAGASSAISFDGVVFPLK